MNPHLLNSYMQHRNASPAPISCPVPAYPPWWWMVSRVAWRSACGWLRRWEVR